MISTKRLLYRGDLINMLYSFLFVDIHSHNTCDSVLVWHLLDTNYYFTAFRWYNNNIIKHLNHQLAKVPVIYRQPNSPTLWILHKFAFFRTLSRNINKYPTTTSVDGTYYSHQMATSVWQFTVSLRWLTNNSFIQLVLSQHTRKDTANWINCLIHTIQMFLII